MPSLRLSAPSVSLLLFLFAFFIGVPVSLYLYGGSGITNEIPWRGMSVLFTFLGAVFVSLPVLLVLQFLPPSIALPIQRILLAGSCYLLFRAYIYPVSARLLDGDSNLAGEVALQQSAEFVVIGLAIYFALRLHENLVRDFVYILSLIVVVCAFYVQFFSAPPTPYTKGGYSTFSKNKNVLIFSFDAIQKEMFERILSSGQYTDMFTGFTHFTDVIAYAPDTNFSVLSTLSGEHLLTGNELETELWSQVRSRTDVTLPSLFQDAGYSAATYNVACVYSNSTCLGMDWVMEDNLKGKSRSSIYDLSLLRVLPEYLAWYVTKSISRVSTNDLLIDKMLNDRITRGWGIDIFAFRKLYQEPLALVDEHVFKFYHYLFTHQPVRFDADCRYDVDLEQNYENAEGLVTCFLNELRQLLIALRAQQAYENSLIIVTSDHGFVRAVQSSKGTEKQGSPSFVNPQGVGSVSRYHPILLVKQPRAHFPYQTSDKPVALIDIYATACAAAAIACDPDSPSYDLAKPENIPDERERRFMVYNGGVQNKKNRTKDSGLFTEVTLRPQEGVGEAMMRVE